MRVAPLELSARLCWLPTPTLASEGGTVSPVLLLPLLPRLPLLPPIPPLPAAGSTGCSSALATSPAPVGAAVGLAAQGTTTGWVAGAKMGRVEVKAAAAAVVGAGAGGEGRVGKGWKAPAPVIRGAAHPLLPLPLLPMPLLLLLLVMVAAPLPPRCWPPLPLERERRRPPKRESLEEEKEAEDAADGCMSRWAGTGSGAPAT